MGLTVGVKAGPVGNAQSHVRLVSDTQTCKSASEPAGGNFPRPGPGARK